MSQASKENLTAQTLSVLTRAWCDLDERIRVIQMKPMPKSVDVAEERERQRKGHRNRAFAEPTEPSKSNGQFKTGEHGPRKLPYTAHGYWSELEKDKARKAPTPTPTEPDPEPDRSPEPEPKGISFAGPTVPTPATPGGAAPFGEEGRHPPSRLISKNGKAGNGGDAGGWAGSVKWGAGGE